MYKLPCRPRARYLWLLVLILAAAPAAAQSLDVGDEVIFSGGPGQPPRSVQTGFSLHVSNLHYTGASASPTKEKPNAAGDSPVNAEEAEPAAPRPAPPLVAYDLSWAPLSRLGELVHSSREPVDRFSAAKALARVTPAARPAGVNLLLQALGDEDLRVVAEAARSLAALREPRAVSPLLELLNQSEPVFLEAILRALGDLGDPRATSAVRSFADGGGGALDLAAREALARLRSARQAANHSRPPVVGGTPRSPF